MTKEASSKAPEKLTPNAQSIAAHWWWRTIANWKVALEYTLELWWRCLYSSWWPHQVYNCTEAIRCAADFVRPESLEMSLSVTMKCSRLPDTDALQLVYFVIYLERSKWKIVYAMQMFVLSYTHVNNSSILEAKVSICWCMSSTSQNKFWIAIFLTW